jgi:hypothetical protein
MTLWSSSAVATTRYYPGIATISIVGSSCFLAQLIVSSIILFRHAFPRRWRCHYHRLSGAQFMSSLPALYKPTPLLSRCPLSSALLLLLLLLLLLRLLRLLRLLLLTGASYCLTTGHPYRHLSVVIVVVCPSSAIDHGMTCSFSYSFYRRCRLAIYCVQAPTCRRVLTVARSLSSAHSLIVACLSSLSSVRRCRCHLKPVSLLMLVSYSIATVSSHTFVGTMAFIS